MKESMYINKLSRAPAMDDLLRLTIAISPPIKGVLCGVPRAVVLVPRMSPGYPDPSPPRYMRNSFKILYIGGQCLQLFSGCNTPPKLVLHQR